MRATRPHTRRRRLAVLAFVVLASIAAIIGLSGGGRLKWNGKPASYWIGRLTHVDVQTGRFPAEEFLFAAGPEVVDELIRGLGKSDNRLADKWHAVYFKLGKWQQYFPMPVKRSLHRMNCARGLGIIGPAASNAVPALLRAMNDSNSFVRSQAIEALGRIGPETPQVTRALLQRLSDTNYNHQLSCVIGLARCIPGSPKAAAALRELVSDSDSNLRAWAADCLWRDDSDREATHKVLTVLLTDTSPAVRDRAAQSLGKMGYEKPRTAETLKTALAAELRTEGNEIVVWKMVTSLGQLGPAAASATSLLKDILSRTNKHSVTVAMIALVQIEPENPEWIAALTRRLEQEDSNEAFWVAWELARRGPSAAGALDALRRVRDTSEDAKVRVTAAAACWRIDPREPDPVPLIAKFLTEHDQSGGYETVKLLAELGPAARPAVPAIQTLRSRGPLMRDYVHEALQAIAPEYANNPWLK